MIRLYLVCSIGMFIVKIFYDGDTYQIETNPLIYIPNQWPGFYDMDVPHERVNSFFEYYPSASLYFCSLALSHITSLCLKL